jgi:hypothetical protein
MAKRRGNFRQDRSTLIPVRTQRARPCPPDFREVYLDIGWDGIEEHFGTSSRVVARWVDESGGDELRAARAEVVRQRGRSETHRVSYAGGWSAEKLDGRRR